MDFQPYTRTPPFNLAQSLLARQRLGINSADQLYSRNSLAPEAALGAT
jgi:hypothetical protein